MQRPGAGRRATLEAPVWVLVIATHDLLREPCLELAQGQGGMLVGVVGAAGLG
jgi:hypothetical protein